MSTKPLGLNVIYIIRAPLVKDTRDNSFYRDWSNATETEIRNCMVEPYPMAEKLNLEENREREFVQSAVRMFVPPETDVVYTDRVRFDDELFQVLGHPFTWFDFRAKRVWKAVIAQFRAG